MKRVVRNSRPDTALDLFPTIRFEASFVARAESAAARLWRVRAARESTGASFASGMGDDVVGARAYRPGDDPRAIDWTASARSDTPLVRVTRRARGGTECIALDASLSMAIGPPGKLQRAAEIAAFLALFAARGGAIVTVIAPPTNVHCVLRSVAEFRALLIALESVRADGRIEGSALRFPRCDRATWIGDLAGARADLLARSASAGTSLGVVQVLAPHEIEPRIDDAAVLVDPESGARITVDRTSLGEHARRTELRRVELTAALARRRARFVQASSAEPFEAAAERFLRA